MASFHDLKVVAILPPLSKGSANELKNYQTRNLCGGMEVDPWAKALKKRGRGSFLTTT